MLLASDLVVCFEGLRSKVSRHAGPSKCRRLNNWNRVWRGFLVIVIVEYTSKPYSNGRFLIPKPGPGPGRDRRSPGGCSTQVGPA